MKIVYILLSGVFLYYLALPARTFPLQLPESVQSTEPADQETPFRRSYFSDYNRNQIMEHYFNDRKNGLYNNPLLTFRLNYPPEEAQTIIRDQARSTFLEEIVHPFRESIFINGYEPKKNQDIIYVNYKNWVHKVTVKQITSSGVARVSMGIVVIIFIPLVLQYLKSSFFESIMTFRKFKI